MTNQSINSFNNNYQLINYLVNQGINQIISQ